MIEEPGRPTQADKFKAMWESITAWPAWMGVGKAHSSEEAG